MSLTEPVLTRPAAPLASGATVAVPSRPELSLRRMGLASVVIPNLAAVVVFSWGAASVLRGMQVHGAILWAIATALLVIGAGNIVALVSNDLQADDHGVTVRRWSRCTAVAWTDVDRIWILRNTRASYRIRVFTRSGQSHDTVTHAFPIDGLVQRIARRAPEGLTVPVERRTWGWARS